LLDSVRNKKQRSSQNQHNQNVGIRQRQASRDSRKVTFEENESRMETKQITKQDSIGENSHRNRELSKLDSGRGIMSGRGSNSPRIFDDPTDGQEVEIRRKSVLISVGKT